MRYWPMAVWSVAVAAGCACRPQDRDVLFQESVMNALVAGVYDGEMTCGELRGHGDVGIGTLDALDGEMVMLEGTVYQVRGDGTVHIAGDSEKTPFAEVTFFEADIEKPMERPMGLKELEDHLDTLIPTRNMLYAVMVAGTFGRVRVRSVPRQAKPYPPLAEAVKAQREFEFNSVRGTVVGFRYPCYAAGINMPGYHFHFLTQDRSAGGHLLDCRLEKGTLMIDVTPRLLIVLPRGSGFSSADMEGDRSGDVEKAEKQ